MRYQIILVLFLSLLITSCAPLSRQEEKGELLAYRLQNNRQTLLEQYLPVFVIEKHNKNYNRIGTPRAELTHGEDNKVFVDSSQGVIYSEQRQFRTQNDTFTNLIYRIHFPETPFELFPFQLGAGKNVGLLVIATLNSNELPVLYTLVHTCGCYLAFIPTTYMPPTAFPHDWPEQKQVVYAETLPSLLDMKTRPEKPFVMVLIKNASHRVKDVWLADAIELNSYRSKSISHEPLASLEKLPLGGAGRTTSFYEESGGREGYVKLSYKPFERLLMGWWAFDWRVGEDKKLSRDKTEPPVFYTSLKPWARDSSDMRDFATFLRYWGWNL